MAQNAVSASEAWVVEAPNCEVMSCWDQFAVHGLANPIKTSNAANSQNRGGIPDRAVGVLGLERGYEGVEDWNCHSEASNDVVTAVSTCGGNMTPYCVPLRSYPLRSVKIEAGRGKRDEGNPLDQSDQVDDPVLGPWTPCPSRGVYGAVSRAVPPSDPQREVHWPWR